MWAPRAVIGMGGTNYALAPPFQWIFGKIIEIEERNIYS
jgi:hypothetical protein